jgi:hypothetical protein
MSAKQTAPIIATIPTVVKEEVEAVGMIRYVGIVGIIGSAATACCSAILFEWL